MIIEIENSGKMEIIEVKKEDLTYLTDLSFISLLDKSEKIYYFKNLHLNISKEDNFHYIMEIIEKYNEKVSNKIILSESDEIGLKNKKNMDYDFLPIIDKNLMKEIIKSYPVDKKYQNLFFKLFKKASEIIHFNKNDLLFGESASEISIDLMTFNNFYLSKKERSNFLLNNFYKRYIGFNSFIGKGLYDSFIIGLPIDMLSDFNIIYINMNDLMIKLTQIEEKINFKNKYLKYKSKYLKLKGGSKLEYGIGIENEFAFTYGNIEEIKGSDFVSLIEGNDSFNKIFKSDRLASIKDELKKLPTVRIIEIVNLVPLIKIYVDENIRVSIFDEELERETIYGLKNFINVEFAKNTLDSNDKINIFDKGHPYNLIQILPPEETAYLSCMFELATSKYKSPSIDLIEKEVLWKRNYGLLLLKKIIKKISVLDEYYNNLNLLKVYDNQPFDFIKMKCFKIDAFSEMDNNIVCNEKGYDYIYNKDYLSSLHFNITLPRPDLTIPLNESENQIHVILVKYLQLFTPILIKKFGVPDFSFSKFGKLTNGSFRMLHSKTIGINSSDSSKPISANRQSSIDFSSEKYDLFKSIDTPNLIDSFDYNFLNTFIEKSDFKLGYDFRQTNNKLGFEYRLMDYCKISCIKTIIKFIFLLYKMIGYKRITQDKCKAINNKIINKQIITFFTTNSNYLDEEYKRLILDCTGFYSKSIDTNEYFSKLYTYLKEIPENIEHKDIFTNLKLHEL
jgi:hypothetical protein